MITTQSQAEGIVVEVDHNFLRKLCPRSTLIGPREMFNIRLVFKIIPEVSKDTNLISFRDNMGAVHSCIVGSSSAPDPASMSHAFS